MRTFDSYLKEQMKDKEFRKEYKKITLENKKVKNRIINGLKKKKDL